MKRASGPVKATLLGAMLFIMEIDRSLEARLSGTTLGFPVLPTSFVLLSKQSPLKKDKRQVVKRYL